MYILLVTLIVLLYFGAASCQGLLLTHKTAHTKWLALGLGLCAASLHTMLLYHWIDLKGGQNLSPFNMFSLVAWLISMLVLVAALTKPVENLSILVFPLAAVSILLVISFPMQDIVNTSQNPRQLIHILLSTLAFSVLCIAALQALLLALQEHQLHQKHLNGVVRFFPPLETMEHLLFQMIGLGFILLTVVLLTSTLFFQDILATVLLQKTIMSLFVWIIFAMLLTGRWYFGWRGRIAIRWTLVGVAALIVLYFGSRLLSVGLSF